MSCECGYADECDGETAVFHPLQVGGMCAVRACQRPRPPPFEPRSILPSERQCCGTFYGSPHRLNCERARSKNA